MRSFILHWGEHKQISKLFKSMHNGADVRRRPEDRRAVGQHDIYGYVNLWALPLSQKMRDEPVCLKSLIIPLQALEGQLRRTHLDTHSHTHSQRTLAHAHSLAHTHTHTDTYTHTHTVGQQRGTGTRTHRSRTHADIAVELEPEKQKGEQETYGATAHEQPQQGPGEGHQRKHIVGHPPYLFNF